MAKKAATVIEGEKLDVLIGSQPLKAESEENEKEKEAVKANILKLLKDKYDIEEDDFLQLKSKSCLQERQGTSVLTEVWSWATVRMTASVPTLLLWLS